MDGSHGNKMYQETTVESSKDEPDLLTQSLASIFGKVDPNSPAPASTHDVSEEPAHKTNSAIAHKNCSSGSSNVAPQNSAADLISEAWNMSSKLTKAWQQDDTSRKSEMAKDILRKYASTEGAAASVPDHHYNAEETENIPEFSPSKENAKESSSVVRLPLEDSNKSDNIRKFIPVPHTPAVTVVSNSPADKIIPSSVNRSDNISQVATILPTPPLCSEINNDVHSFIKDNEGKKNDERKPNDEKIPDNDGELLDCERRPAINDEGLSIDRRVNDKMETPLNNTVSNETNEFHETNSKVTEETNGDINTAIMSTETLAEDQSMKPSEAVTIAEGIGNGEDNDEDCDETAELSSPNRRLGSSEDISEDPALATKLNKTAPDESVESDTVDKTQPCKSTTPTKSHHVHTSTKIISPNSELNERPQRKRKLPLKLCETSNSKETSDHKKSRTLRSSLGSQKDKTTPPPAKNQSKDFQNHENFQNYETKETDEQRKRRKLAEFQQLYLQKRSQPDENTHDTTLPHKRTFSLMDIGISLNAKGEVTLTMPDEVKRLASAGGSININFDVDCLDEENCLKFKVTEDCDATPRFTPKEVSATPRFTPKEVSTNEKKSVPFISVSSGSSSDADDTEALRLRKNLVLPTKTCDTIAENPSCTSLSVSSTVSTLRTENNLCQTKNSSICPMDTSPLPQNEDHHNIVVKPGTLDNKPEVSMSNCLPPTLEISKRDTSTQVNIDQDKDDEYVDEKLLRSANGFVSLPRFLQVSGTSTATVHKILKNVKKGLSVDKKTNRPTWFCSLCNLTGDYGDLGPLFGPFDLYIPSKKSYHNKSLSDGAKNLFEKLSSTFNTCSALTPEQSDRPDVEREEVWVHEDCVTWSPGVYMLGFDVYGLEEIFKVARFTLCSTCNQIGANLGCFKETCLKRYHYYCAVKANCKLIKTTFTILCPTHSHGIVDNNCVANQPLMQVRNFLSKEEIDESEALAKSALHGRKPLEDVGSREKAVKITKTRIIRTRKRKKKRSGQAEPESVEQQSHSGKKVLGKLLFKHTCYGCGIYFLTTERKSIKRHFRLSTNCWKKHMKALEEKDFTGEIMEPCLGCGLFYHAGGLAHHFGYSAKCKNSAQARAARAGSSASARASTRDNSSERKEEENSASEEEEIPAPPKEPLREPGTGRFKRNARASFRNTESSLVPKEPDFLTKEPDILECSACSTRTKDRNYLKKHYRDNHCTVGCGDYDLICTDCVRQLKKIVSFPRGLEGYNYSKIAQVELKCPDCSTTSKKHNHYYIRQHYRQQHCSIGCSKFDQICVGCVAVLEVITEWPKPLIGHDYSTGPPSLGVQCPVCKKAVEKKYFGRHYRHNHCEVHCIEYDHLCATCFKLFKRMNLEVGDSTTKY